MEVHGQTTAIKLNSIYITILAQDKNQSFSRKRTVAGPVNIQVMKGIRVGAKGVGVEKNKDALAVPRAGQPPWKSNCPCHAGSASILPAQSKRGGTNRRFLAAVLFLCSYLAPLGAPQVVCIKLHLISSPLHHRHHQWPLPTSPSTRVPRSPSSAWVSPPNRPLPSPLHSLHYHPPSPPINLLSSVRSRAILSTC